MLSKHRNAGSGHPLSGSNYGLVLEPVAADQDVGMDQAAWASARRLALAALLILVSTTCANADFIVASVINEIEMTVQDPKDPTKCISVVLGELGGRLGDDKVQMTMVAGFHKTYNGTTCCDSIHFLNVVVNDPNPPAWKDDKGTKHQIGNGEIYVDPLSGGNIPPGQDAPNPQADRLPFYDGERFTRKASTTGDFIKGEKKEYDLDHDVPPSPDWPWNNDPTLDNTFADGPTLTTGLEFVTILVCVNGKTLTPLGGIPWGVDATGTEYIRDVFQDSSYPGGLTNGKLNDALKRSGFGDYSMGADPCNCVPEPSTFVLLLSGLAGLAPWARRVRRMAA